MCTLANSLGRGRELAKNAPNINTDHKINTRIVHVQVASFRTRAFIEKNALLSKVRLNIDYCFRYFSVTNRSIMKTTLFIVLVLLAALYMADGRSFFEDQTTLNKFVRRTGIRCRRLKTSVF